MGRASRGGSSDDPLARKQAWLHDVQSQSGSDPITHRRRFSWFIGRRAGRETGHMVTVTSTLRLSTGDKQ